MVLLIEKISTPTPLFLSAVKGLVTAFPYSRRDRTRPCTTIWKQFFRGRSGKTECTLCGAECVQSVVHVLWECPAYKNSRDPSMENLRDAGRKIRTTVHC